MGEALVTSGLVDAHSHLRSTSLASHGVTASGGLEEALLRFTGMSAVDPRDDSFIACSRLLLSGFTGVQAMFHAFLAAPEYLDVLRRVAAGVRDSGIRALIILGITDQNEFLPAGLANQALLPSWLPPKCNLAPEDLSVVLSRISAEFPEISFGIGPVGPQWCSDQALEGLGALASEGWRVHSHLLESSLQRKWISEEPLTRLQRFGLLGDRTSLAHGVWAESADLEAIANSGAQLVYCPGSNSLLRSGTANVSEWRRHGVSFGFGLDSSTEASTAFGLAASVLEREALLEALTDGGRRATSLPCDQDLVLWQDFDRGHAWDVTVGGEKLVSEGTLLKQSELEAAAQRTEEAMLRDAVARESRVRALDDLMPRYLAALESCCS